LEKKYVKIFKIAFILKISGLLVAKTCRCFSQNMYIFWRKHVHLFPKTSTSFGATLPRKSESRVGEKFGKKKGTPRAPHLDFFGEEKIVTYDL